LKSTLWLNEPSRTPMKYDEPHEGACIELCSSSGKGVGDLSRPYRGFKWNVVVLSQRLTPLANGFRPKRG
jgi:hypothetical protein